MTALVFDGVAKGYARGGAWTPVLAGASLVLEPGDFVALVGGRGSGRTTLLRLAAGVERPDAGAVRVGGVDLAALSIARRARVLRREVGLARPALPLAARTTAVDHVAVPVLGEGRRPAEAGLVAHRALERVGAEALAGAALHELSPREVARVALARALVREPGLLLVDDASSLGDEDEAGELLAGLAAPSRTILAAVERPADLPAARHAMVLAGGRIAFTERGMATVAALPVRRSPAEAPA